MKISESYKREQETLHLDPDYGQASATYAPIVSQICTRLKIKQLLDYGCGKGRLFQSLDVQHDMKLQAYDPGIPAFAGEPVPMQMVACIDVLEHIEPECLDAVLDDLVRVTEMVGFFTVCTVAAERSLSDGRNAHLIQRDMAWWFNQLASRFDIQTLQVVGDSFFVIVYARKPLVETIQ